MSKKKRGAKKQGGSVEARFIATYTLLSDSSRLFNGAIEQIRTDIEFKSATWVSGSAGNNTPRYAALPLERKS